MAFEDFDPIFGEPKVECADHSSCPLRPFLFHAHAPDSSHLAIHVTDFHSDTWESRLSVPLLEDIRDIIGIGGSWSEFVEYFVGSLKSEDLKLVLEANSNSDGVSSAKLVAQKSKGMPLITIPLTKLEDSAASEAKSNLSLRLFKAFNNIKCSLVEERFVLLHNNGKIVSTTEGGYSFVSEDEQMIVVSPTISFAEFQTKVLEAFDQQHMVVKKLTYKIPIVGSPVMIKFGKMRIRNDADIALMFQVSTMHPQVTVMEVLAEIKEVGRFRAPALQGQVNVDVGGSGCGGGSAGFVGSGGDGEFAGVGGSGDTAGLGGVGSSFGRSVAGSPAGMGHTRHWSPTFNVGHDSRTIPEPTNEDAQHEFDFNDAVEDEYELENVDVVGANAGEETHEDEEEAQTVEAETAAEPRVWSQRRGRPAHYDSVADDVQVGDDGPNEPMFDVEGENEFFIGQLFPDRETVKLAVKSYSLRRFAQYKVHESAAARFQARCLEFGNGCNWSIRISYIRQRELWVVRKYNGPHTCRSVLPNNEHRQLDSDMICHVIFPIVEKTPNVKIRVLEEAVRQKFGFPTTYRKVWIAKQKVVAKIFGDWEASYNEFPRWIQAVQPQVPEQERSGRLTNMIAAEKEINETVQQQLEQRHKFQKISDSEKVGVSTNGQKNSPDKQTARDTPTKVKNRVVPVHRRTKVRGALLHGSDDV